MDVHVRTYIVAVHR